MNTSRTEAKTVINRQGISQGYRDNRERPGALFGIASQDAYYDSPARYRFAIRSLFTTVTFPHLPSMSHA